MKIYLSKIAAFAWDSFLLPGKIAIGLCRRISLDAVGEVAAVVTLFLAFGAAYCIACPPEPAHHAAHSMQLPIFAKTAIRAR